MFATAIVLSTNAFAQNNVKKSLDNFISNRNIKFTSKISETKDPVSNKLISKCNIYKFTMPSKDNPITYFDNIYNAFEKDKDLAYWSIRQDANTPDRETWNIIYGNDGEYITIGESDSKNVLAMNVIDRNDTTCRYSYILEWMTDKKENHIVGDIMFLYGKMPNKKKSKLGILGFPFFDDRESHDTKINGTRINDDTLFYNIDGKQQSMIIPKLKYGTLKNRLMTDDSDYEDNDSDNTTAGWLSKFGVLTNMYGGNGILSSSIVSKIVDLCKRSKGVISPKEKTLCIDRLREMKQKTKDKFQKGLIDEAIDYLQ